MTWPLHSSIDLRNDRVPKADADRQSATAATILERLNQQPGIVLADEVGMGKTYVALAVAVSCIEAGKRKRPVVVMAPPSVVDKWPTEWAVFSDRCLAPGHGLRASGALRSGTDFLKLLDDPDAECKHLIFLTHGALTNSLADPFIKLALLRQATLRRSGGEGRRRALAKAAGGLLNDRRFRDPAMVLDLVETPPSQWRATWNSWNPGHQLDDDPVPTAVLRALPGIDTTDLWATVQDIPAYVTESYDDRLRAARKPLADALRSMWNACLRNLQEQLPLLILDEAHHVKNANKLASLFANDEASEEADVERGPLGNMFGRMLFLTATPFQLGHNELLSVLDRFNGIRWRSATERRRFNDQLDELRTALDRAQATALQFERAWSRIDIQDAARVAELDDFSATSGDPNDPLAAALQLGSETEAAMATAEDLLRPWIIRHVRAGVDRRSYRTGRAILDDVPTDVGLAVDGPATLPFLLAARAQALAGLIGADGQKQTRSLFAYGLASSYEAYADTRRNRAAAIDEVDLVPTSEEAAPADDRLTWYLDWIGRALPEDVAEDWSSHPKVAATVKRATELWWQGEKSLIFCFYVETGRALRAHISRALLDQVTSRAADQLEMDPSEPDPVLAHLGRISERLLSSDAPGYKRFHTHLMGLAQQLEPGQQAELADIVVRFMRTPSYLVRFVDLSERTTIDHLVAGLERADESGTTLATRIEMFAESLRRKVDVEREDVLGGLAKIQTGSIVAGSDDFDPSEHRTTRREVLLPNVRLANGGVAAETRRRLMLGFNTPFFPEILVASAVMAEGVDLHQACRHVIHHDLDWNPSTLEQRTGRVDRIGSKAERSGHPVVVYQPFVGGTHDEKMFRVVKDRERWFGIVMGGAVDDGTSEVDATDERVPLPPALANRLTMNLAVQDDSTTPTSSRAAT